MSTKVLQKYLIECNNKGIEPSIRGLKIYKLEAVVLC